MPKSCERCVTSLSVSSNVPPSSRNSIRSRAFILPSLCCRSRRSVPPPSSARRSRFLGINRHYGFLAHGQLLHRKLLKGEIDDNKLSFGLGRTPAVRPCAVNDQQCQATPLRIFWCELCRNLGIAVPEKRIVRIDHL